jgi:Ca2+-binding RTX toxin-like protein
MAKMSTVQYYDRFYTEDTNFTSLIMLSETKTRVVCQDPTSLNRVIFQGENLIVEHGMIISGTIEDAIIADTRGKPFYEFSGFKVDARVIGDDKLLDYAVDVVARAAAGNNKMIGTSHGDDLYGAAGNDILLGKGGADQMGGGPGTDIMTGGGGFDTFQFAKGYGKDTITDFDADGGPGAQDLIQATFTDVVSIDKSGENTIIDFGNGDTLTLLHVKPSQIDATDFTT